jgi:hypothetical protein
LSRSGHSTQSVTALRRHGRIIPEKRQQAAGEKSPAARAASLDCRRPS